MKISFMFLLTTLIWQAALSQDKTMVEKSYLDVIKNGLSTAPDLIVITVNNLKNKISKEICTEVTSFYFSVAKEHPEMDDKKLSQYLLSKSSERTFDFKNDSSLKEMNFFDYQLRNQSEIDNVIERVHLKDSLRNFVKFRESLSKEYDYYYEKRGNILTNIADSIKAIRSLSDEETKMLGDLTDRYYDDYYTNPVYNKYRTVSDQG